MSTRRQCKVTFLSPGTFVSEQTSKPIASYDVQLAVEISRSITERYGATPYGFYFSTQIESDPISDGEGGQLNVEPKTVDESKMYYINGEIETIADVEARNDPSESILLSNMKCNNWDRIVVTRNGYKHTRPFNDGDHIVNLKGEITL